MTIDCYNTATIRYLPTIKFGGSIAGAYHRTLSMIYDYTI